MPAPDDGPSSSLAPPLSPSIETEARKLLARPPAERLREYRYRFAQSIVFGLPVLALQWFGHQLGGADASRWVGLMQALLAGWVLYVGAAGMLFEGMLLILWRCTLRPDGFVALAAGMIYLLSVCSWVSLLLPRQPPLGWMRFHWVVLIIGVWTGIQWYRWRMRQTEGKTRA